MAFVRLHIDVCLHRKKLAVQRAQPRSCGVPRGGGLGIVQQPIWRNAKENLPLRVL